MKGSTAFGLGCAFLVGVALAFPAALMFARRSPPDSDRVTPPAGRHARLLNPYSPNIMSDPYVLEQQRKGLEALDRSCREAGTYCREAAQLRQLLQTRGGEP